MTDLRDSNDMSLSWVLVERSKRDAAYMGNALLMVFRGLGSFSSSLQTSSVKPFGQNLTGHSGQDQPYSPLIYGVRGLPFFLSKPS